MAEASSLPAAFSVLAVLQQYIILLLIFRVSAFNVIKFSAWHYRYWRLEKPFGYILVVLGLSVERLTSVVN